MAKATVCDICDRKIPEGDQEPMTSFVKYRGGGANRFVQILIHWDGKFVDACRDCQAAAARAFVESVWGVSAMPDWERPTSA